jgi:hypothetical protein
MERQRRNRSETAFIWLGMFVGALIGGAIGYLAFLLISAMIGQFLHLGPACIAIVLFCALVGGGVGLLGGIILQLMVTGADRD